MREFNGAMLQAFHWYTPADGTLWNRLAEEAPALAAAGFTSVWLPPAYKGAGGGLDTGYGAYDLFDLGAPSTAPEPSTCGPSRPPTPPASRCMPMSS